MAVVHQSEYQIATAGRHRDHALPEAHAQAQRELDHSLIGVAITQASAAEAAAAAAQAAAEIAQDAADDAATAAAAANALLADIASDSKLTPGEKPTVIEDRDALVNEQAGIVASADAYSVSHAAYDAAITALTDYLATLTSPVAWDNLGGNTDIVGATFRTKFLDAYSAKQALLNAIAAAAKALADAAQSTADTANTAAGAAQAAASAAAAAAEAAQGAADAAQSAADTANGKLADIASDSVLTPDEKPTVIGNRDAITNEQSGIDASATAFSVSHTAYDDAVTALTTYLATLTTPVAWDNLTDKTTIVGATFRTKFLDVYSARQTLLNAIAAAAKTLADNAQDAADAAATDATNALGQLSAIADDNKVTPAEKLAVLRDWRYLDAEQAQLDAQADLYAISRSTYDTKIQALRDYMDDDLGLVLGVTDEPTWLASTATITGSTFRTRFKEAYDAEVALVKAITEAAKVITIVRLSGGLANSVAAHWPNGDSENAPPAGYVFPGDESDDAEFGYRYVDATEAYSGTCVRRLAESVAASKSLRFVGLAYPNDTHRFAVRTRYMADGTGTGGEITIEYLDSDGSTLVTHTKTLDAPNSYNREFWDRYVLRSTSAPNGTVRVRFTITLTRGSATLAILYVDEIDTERFPWEADGNGWWDLTLQNSWVNYGSGYPYAGVREDSFGVVQLRGMIKAGTLNAVVATLPAWLCPPTEHHFICASYLGYAQVLVRTNGQIVLGCDGVGGSTTWSCLDGIFFDRREEE